MYSKKMQNFAFHIAEKFVKSERKSICHALLAPPRNRNFCQSLLFRARELKFWLPEFFEPICCPAPLYESKTKSQNIS
jgi:hypothetical protein